MAKNDKWVGIFKLGEESGELIEVLADFIQRLSRLQCVLGKLGPFPSGQHPDGAGDLKTRLEDELADVAAASIYLAEENGLDEDRMAERAAAKVLWQVLNNLVGNVVQLKKS